MSMASVVKWRAAKRELWAQAGRGEGDRKDHAIVGYDPGSHRPLSLCGARVSTVHILLVGQRPDRARCCATCWQLADSRGPLLQPCPVCSRMMESYPSGKLRYHTLSFRTPCPGACERP